MALVDAAPRMRTKRRCLPLLLLAFVIPSSVDASCESYAATLARINTEEKESYKKARKAFVEEKLGHVYEAIRQIRQKMKEDVQWNRFVCGELGEKKKMHDRNGVRDRNRMRDCINKWATA